MAYLHQQNRYHCDLKSPNILVATNWNHIKICDFGLAHERDIGFPTVLGSVGTHPWMAPESESSERASEFHDGSTAAEKQYCSFLFTSDEWCDQEGRIGLCIL